MGVGVVTLCHINNTWGGCWKENVSYITHDKQYLGVLKGKRIVHNTSVSLYSIMGYSHHRYYSRPPGSIRNLPFSVMIINLRPFSPLLNSFFLPHKPIPLQPVIIEWFTLLPTMALMATAFDSADNGKSVGLCFKRHFINKMKRNLLSHEQERILYELLYLTAFGDRCVLLVCFVTWLKFDICGSSWRAEATVARGFDICESTWTAEATVARGFMGRYRQPGATQTYCTKNFCSFFGMSICFSPSQQAHYAVNSDVITQTICIKHYWGS